MRSTLFLTAILLTVLGATVAHATPSTLIWIPSTDLQADGTWHLGIDNYFTKTDGYRSPTDLGLTYGLLGGRAEVGVDYLGGSDDPLYFNAKYLLLPESEEVPALAVGVYNLGTESGVTDYNMLYVLGAKTFGPVRVTLGYCKGKESTLGCDSDMLLAGVDGYLTSDKKWWGAIDYQSGDNAFGALSFGASYAVTDKVSLLLGYDLYNDSALDDTITTQLDINF